MYRGRSPRRKTAINTWIEPTITASRPIASAASIRCSGSKIDRALNTTSEIALVGRRPRTATPPATIGAFYDTLSAGFTTVNPTINSAAHAVHMGEAFPIHSIADAQAAIARIKGEGEGTSGSPEEPPPEATQFAHYYVFKEIYVGKTLVQTDGKWGFTGSPIQMPTAFAFSQSSVTPDPSLAFNQALSQLLINLQSCWTSGASPNIGAMFALRDLGIGLIQQGIRPEFLWAAPSGG